MGFLFGFTIALILYGTLYPFDFTAGAHAGGAISLLIESIKERLGYGDVLSNVVLFLPFGFFGMQCLSYQRMRFACTVAR